MHASCEQCVLKEEIVSSSTITGFTGSIMYAVFAFGCFQTPCDQWGKRKWRRIWLICTERSARFNCDKLVLNHKTCCIIATEGMQLSGLLTSHAGTLRITYWHHMQALCAYSACTSACLLWSWAVLHGVIPTTSLHAFCIRAVFLAIGVHTIVVP